MGEGQGVFLEGNKEGIRRRELKGDRGSVGVTWGRVMWQGILTGI